MTSATQMTNLFIQLQKVGIKKSFARKVLPNWWDDSITSSDAGLQQAQLYLSKAFNLDIASLSDQEASPKFRIVAHKFKKNANVNEADLSASAHYATAISRLALKATNSGYEPPPNDPIELRRQILQTANSVNLPALLSWCGTAGIPVLHIAKLPGRKMVGLSIRINNRFAVVLSRDGHPSEILFHLAHELGHIAKGHLSNDGFLADQNIGTSNQDDADEKEADAYAIRLLNGAEVKYKAHGRYLRDNELYQAAKELADSSNIDVGHIILNYGHTQGQFPLAQKALKLIPGLELNSNKVVNSELFRHVDNDYLSEDQLALLHTATNFPTL